MVSFSDMCFHGAHACHLAQKVIKLKKQYDKETLYGTMKEL